MPHDNVRRTGDAQERKEVQKNYPPQTKTERQTSCTTNRTEARRQARCAGPWKQTCLTRRRAESGFEAGSSRRGWVCAGNLVVPNFALFDEFLFPDELASLQEYVRRRESRFRSSAVLSRDSKTVIQPRHRRSRVLVAGPYGELIIARLRACFDRILDALGAEAFPFWFADAQITASGDGDFFRPHADSDASDSRWLTYVYYFHREPKRFRGGELLLYRPNQGWAHDTIVPRCNQMVAFRPSLVHEVRPVRCPSGSFADSRFTLNGWIHREPPAH